MAMGLMVDYSLYTLEFPAIYKSQNAVSELPLLLETVFSIS
jgi:hypothetical protein